MAIVAIILFVLIVLYVYGRGPRKVAAEVIVKGEDVKAKTTSAVKASPAVAEEIKNKTQKVVVSTVSTGSAVGKVVTQKGSKVGAVAASKAFEFADESKHYVRGFVSDVGVERKKIISSRKRMARAERVAKSQKKKSQLALPEKSSC